MVAGGVNSCTDFLPLLGAPPYGDFEDDVIGGNLTITGWLSCWLGWFRDTVMNNVNFDGNVSGDPDGSEMANNTVLGNLNCSGNSPSLKSETPWAVQPQSPAMRTVGAPSSPGS